MSSGAEHRTTFIQGRAMDVIFISAVRANDKGSVGFLKDERRLNVAITRARHAHIVVGHAKTLFRGVATWQRLINHAASNQCALLTQLLSRIHSVLLNN